MKKFINNYFSLFNFEIIYNIYNYNYYQKNDMSKQLKAAMAPQRETSSDMRSSSLNIDFVQRMASNVPTQNKPRTSTHLNVRSTGRRFVYSTASSRIGSARVGGKGTPGNNTTRVASQASGEVLRGAVVQKENIKVPKLPPEAPPVAVQSARYGTQAEHNIEIRKNFSKREAQKQYKKLINRRNVLNMKDQMDAQKDLKEQLKITNDRNLYLNNQRRDRFNQIVNQQVSTAVIRGNNTHESLFGGPFESARTRMFLEPTEEGLAPIADEDPKLKLQNVQSGKMSFNKHTDISENTNRVISPMSLTGGVQSPHSSNQPFTSRQDDKSHGGPGITPGLLSSARIHSQTKTFRPFYQGAGTQSFQNFHPILSSRAGGIADPARKLLPGGRIQKKRQKSSYVGKTKKMTGSGFYPQQYKARDAEELKKQLNSDLLSDSKSNVNLDPTTTPHFTPRRKEQPGSGLKSWQTQDQRIDEKPEDLAATLKKDASGVHLNQISKSSVAKESSDDQVGRISRYHNRPDSGTSVITKLNIAKINQNREVEHVEPNIESVEARSPDKQADGERTQRDDGTLFRTLQNTAREESPARRTQGQGGDVSFDDGNMGLSTGRQIVMAHGAGGTNPQSSDRRSAAVMSKKLGSVTYYDYKEQQAQREAEKIQADIERSIDEFHYLIDQEQIQNLTDLSYGILRGTFGVEFRDHPLFLGIDAIPLRQENLKLIQKKLIENQIFINQNVLLAQTATEVTSKQTLLDDLNSLGLREEKSLFKGVAEVIGQSDRMMQPYSTIRGVVKTTKQKEEEREQVERQINKQLQRRVESFKTKIKKRAELQSIINQGLEFMQDPTKTGQDLEPCATETRNSNFKLEDRLNSSNLWALAQMVERQKNLMAENLKKQAIQGQIQLLEASKFDSVQAQNQSADRQNTTDDAHTALSFDHGPNTRLADGAHASGGLGSPRDAFGSFERFNETIKIQEQMSRQPDLDSAHRHLRSSGRGSGHNRLEHDLVGRESIPSHGVRPQAEVEVVPHPPGHTITAGTMPTKNARFQRMKSQLHMMATMHAYEADGLKKAAQVQRKTPAAGEPLGKVTTRHKSSKSYQNILHLKNQMAKQRLRVNASVQMKGEKEEKKTVDISGIQGEEKDLNEREAPPVKWTRKKKNKGKEAKKSRNNPKGLDPDASSKKHTLHDKDATELAGTDNSLTPKGEEIHQINLQLESQYQTTERLNANLHDLGIIGPPRTQRLSMAISRDPSNNELLHEFPPRGPSPKEATQSPRKIEPQNQKSPTKLQGKPSAKCKNNLNFLTRNLTATGSPERDEKDIQIVKKIVLQPKKKVQEAGAPQTLAKTTSAVLIIDRVEQVLKTKEKEFQDDYGLIKGSENEKGAGKVKMNLQLDKVSEGKQQLNETGLLGVSWIENDGVSGSPNQRLGKNKTFSHSPPYFQEGTIRVVKNGGSEAETPTIMHHEKSQKSLGKGPASTLVVKQFVSKKDVNTQLREEEEEAPSMRTPEDARSGMEQEEDGQVRLSKMIENRTKYRLATDVHPSQADLSRVGSANQRADASRGSLTAPGKGTKTKTRSATRGSPRGPQMFQNNMYLFKKVPSIRSGQQVSTGSKGKKKTKDAHMNVDLGDQDPEFVPKKKRSLKIEDRAHKRLDMSDEEVKIKQGSKLSTQENEQDLSPKEARISFRMPQKDLQTARENKERSDSPEFPSVGYHLKGKTMQTIAGLPGPIRKGHNSGRRKTNLVDCEETIIELTKEQAFDDSREAVVKVINSQKFCLKSKVASTVGKSGLDRKSPSVVRGTSAIRTITNQSDVKFQSPLKFHLVPAETGHFGGEVVKQTVIIQDIAQEQQSRPQNLVLRAHNTSIGKKDKISRERSSDIFILPQNVPAYRNLSPQIYQTIHKSSQEIFAPGSPISQQEQTAPDISLTHEAMKRVIGLNHRQSGSASSTGGDGVTSGMPLSARGSIGKAESVAKRSRTGVLYQPIPSSNQQIVIQSSPRGSPKSRNPPDQPRLSAEDYKILDIRKVQSIEEKKNRTQQDRGAKKSTSRGRLKKGLNLITEQTAKASFCSPRNLNMKGATADATIMAAGQQMKAMDRTLTELAVIHGNKFYKLEFQNNRANVIVESSKIMYDEDQRLSDTRDVNMTSTSKGQAQIGPQQQHMHFVGDQPQTARGESSSSPTKSQRIPRSDSNTGSALLVNGVHFPASRAAILIKAHGQNVGSSGMAPQHATADEIVQEFILKGDAMADLSPAKLRTNGPSLEVTPMKGEAGQPANDVRKSINTDMNHMFDNELYRGFMQSADTSNIIQQSQRKHQQY